MWIQTPDRLDLLWTTSGWTDKDRYQYKYDRDGNPLYKDNQLSSSNSELYHHSNGATAGYDSLNRLTDFARGTLSDANSDTVLDTISSPNRTQSWSLDAVGNMSTVTTGGTPQSRTHNKQNQLTVMGGNSLSYDANGNMIVDENGNHLVYDAWNHLVQFNTSGDDPIVSYVYDALGRQVQRFEWSADTRDGHEGEFFASIEQDFYYTTDWQVAEQLQTDFEIDGDDIIEVDAYIANSYVWSIGYVNDLIERDRDSNGDGSFDERIYAMDDANHNVTGIVNTSGTVLERFVYDPYGARMVLAANWTSTSDAYGFLNGFQGGIADATTGMILFQRRYYSPTLSRWVSSDPSPAGMYVDGMNSYGFVGDSPTAMMDASGLMPNQRDPWTLKKLVKQITDFETAAKGDKKKKSDPISIAWDLVNWLTQPLETDKNVWPNWHYNYFQSQEVQGGWIDDFHFFRSAIAAAKYNATASYVGGWMHELDSDIRAKASDRGNGASKWNPEDLVSDGWGAVFGAQLDCCKPLSEQTEAFLKVLNPLDQFDQAPNFRVLPQTEQEWESWWNYRTLYTTTIRGKKITIGRWDPNPVATWSMEGYWKLWYNPKAEIPPKPVVAPANGPTSAPSGPS